MNSKRNPPRKSKKIVSQTMIKKPLLRDVFLSSDYGRFLQDIKIRIRTSRIKAALSVNCELIVLYWEIGKSIVRQQKKDGWGKAVVERLAEDLQKELPSESGFSAINLWRMRAFYLSWTKDVKKLQNDIRKTRDGILSQTATDLTAEILSQLVTELTEDQPPSTLSAIPWGHNLVLLHKLNGPIQRLWYARQTIEHGWSRSVLVHQIETGLYERQGKALTNFSATLPTPQSDLASQLIKDPYNFGFIGLGTDISERQLEGALIDRIKDFLMELGKGFSFIGQQYHLEVVGKDYFMDLLFYHLHLRCFIIIDLKVVPFEPEFAGKMNFYLSAVDDKLRHPADHPTIGIILCKKRNKIVVEYALCDTNKPMGVATYRILPAKLKADLPSAQQLEDWIKRNGPRSNKTPGY